MRSFSLHLAVPCLLFFAVGCSDVSGGGDGALVPALDVREVLRIGSPDDPEYSLTWFGELEVGPEGKVYTLHQQSNEIRVHDPAGRLLRTFAGAGEGPGELKNPGSMGMTGDTLWVLDRGTFRVTYFDLEGNLLRSVRVPVDLGSGPGGRPPRPRGLLADGSVYGAPPAFSRMVASGELTHQVMVTMDEKGAAKDTLFRYSLENTTLELSVPNDPEGRASFGPQPWSDTELARVSPVEMAYVRVRRRVGPDGTEPVRVTKTSLDGREIFSVELPVEPVPLSAEDTDRFVQRWADRASQSFYKGIARGRLEEVVRENLYAPPFHPPVSDLLPGRDGSVWLAGPKVTGEKETRWTILDADGRPVGRVSLPRRFFPLEAEVGQVWGMELDELDVPYIVSYEVEPAEGSAA